MNEKVILVHKQVSRLCTIVLSVHTCNYQMMSLGIKSNVYLGDPGTV